MVVDGEVGALTVQAESEESPLVVFICGSQGSYDLRRNRNKIKSMLDTNCIYCVSNLNVDSIQPIQSFKSKAVSLHVLLRRQLFAGWVDLACVCVC